MGNGDLKQYENSKHRPKYMVSDLLIQSRGYERNYNGPLKLDTELRQIDT